MRLQYMMMILIIVTQEERHPSTSEKEMREERWERLAQFAWTCSVVLYYYHRGDRM